MEGDIGRRKQTLSLELKWSLALTTMLRMASEALRNDSFLVGRNIKAITRRDRINIFFAIFTHELENIRVVFFLVSVLCYIYNVMHGL